MGVDGYLLGENDRLIGMIVYLKKIDFASHLREQ